ncbi:spore cortex-lytic enzyme [Natronospora cellulosivora (SeqCode)]
MRKKSLYLFLSILLLFIIVGTLFYLPTIEAAQPTLSWGSTGASVRTLQRRLSNWGYYDGSIDGVFGRLTYQAVTDFQRRNRLTVDGIVGRQTWAALGYEWAGNATQAAQPAQGGGTRGVSRDSDVEMLARIIHAEARGEPFEGMVAVGAVVLNRIESPSFPNSLSGVIYQPLAFESVADRQFYLPPNEESLRAARSAINGWDPTHGTLFFWNPAKPVSPWIWTRTITRRIGNHVFGL